MVIEQQSLNTPTKTTKSITTYKMHMQYTVELVLNGHPLRLRK